ncbi:MAG: phosphotransferase [Clostridiales bacterium]|nr:phosphotransferase [Clostridiales bacterium]
MLNTMPCVANCFDYKGTILSIEKLGSGHINSTYLVATTAQKYVLQQINTAVFPNVEELMSNMLKVTRHIAKKQFASSLVATKQGKYFTEYDGKFFRMYDLVDGICIENAKTCKEMYLTGLGFGLFQKEMRNFNESLYEVIPDFHNTVKRYHNLIEAYNKDSANRAVCCQDIVDTLLKYKDYSNIIVDKISSGELPKRTVHNDAKINNLIVDVVNCKPISVIDLDTVMEGSLLYDFGDAVRSGCNSSFEDEEDVSKIYLRQDFFRALCRGFFMHTRDMLKKEEIELLALSGVILTYECALRFLTDSLNGDIYFKVAKPNHNLIRAKAQLALMQDMLKNILTLEDIVKQELNNLNL